MKKTFFSLAIILLCVSAKSQTSGTPSSAATQFLKAMITLNVQDAEKYVDSNTVGTLKQIEPMITQQSAIVPDSIKTLLANAAVTADSERITGDSATVDVLVDLGKSLHGIQHQKQKMVLVKQSGDWKVVFKFPNEGDSSEGDDKE